MVHAILTDEDDNGESGNHFELTIILSGLLDLVLFIWKLKYRCLFIYIVMNIYGPSSVKIVEPFRIMSIIIFNFVSEH